MPESLGARLRRRREEQQIALSAIAEQTKIKQSLLEALERDDVSHWPSGIFRRAYIRAYAEAIGLSPDVVVREFLEAHPEPVELDAAALAAALARDAAPGQGGPPTRLRYIMGSAMGSLSRFRRATASDAPVVTHARSLVNHDRASIVFDPPPPVTDSTAIEPPAPDVERKGTIDSPAAPEPDAAGPDWLAVAHLCTELGRVGSGEDVASLLQEAAAIVDASGLIVWIWDPVELELKPALAHGYSQQVLAHVSGVKRDADNATAAAFRSGQPSVIAATDRCSGALVTPLLTAAGCAGVLALELSNGREQSAAIRAVATIFAALLAQLLGGVQSAEVPLEPALCPGA